MGIGRNLAIALATTGLAFGASAQERPDPDTLTAAGDGPYLTPGWSRGWLARSVSPDLTPVEQRVARTGQITVAAVGDVPAFTVPLRPITAGPAPDTLPLDPSTRLMVLADTHGEYEIVVEFLRRQGVIDADLTWAFGDGQMVVTGDIFDRGAHQLEILWLFYKLEAEAREAGGALHVLLGNHENIVLRNDLRYLHPRYVETARILGVETYPDLFAPETLLGDWLRSRPAVLKLGDMLLLHGGISPQVLDANLTVSDLNRLVLASLQTPVARRSELDPQTALVAGSFGPLWFRGYFPEQATLERPYMPTAEVQRSLTQFGVERILVGHTVMDQVTPLYDGRVIAVQVYPDRDDETGLPILEGALRDQGRWFRVNAQGERVMLELDGD
ncbi:MAG: metallophosphoesterase [Caulobacterales bacterium]|nr:metallophosphoesterase [Caulobacterales bacterium]